MLVNSVPRSDKIDQGAPKYATTDSYKHLLTVEALWFLTGMVIRYLEYTSIIVTMYLLDLPSTGRGPTMSMLTVSHGPGLLI